MTKSSPPDKPFLFVLDEYATFESKNEGKEQIGWYNPNNERFCYLYERKYASKRFKAYWMPVFIETVVQSAAKAA